MGIRSADEVRKSRAIAVARCVVSMVARVRPVSRRRGAAARCGPSEAVMREFDRNGNDGEPGVEKSAQ